MARPTETGVGGTEGEGTGPFLQPQDSRAMLLAGVLPGFTPTGSNEGQCLGSPSHACGNRCGTGRLGLASQDLVRAVSMHPPCPLIPRPHTLGAGEE